MAGSAEVDGNYDYRLFSQREGGCVPCLRLGEDYMSTDGEITGIAFQKVNEGTVRPVMEDAAFSRVEWTNYPSRTNPVVNPLNIVVQGPVVQTDRVTRFSAFMSNLKHTLIDQSQNNDAIAGPQIRMTPEGGPTPASLLQGFMSDVFEYQQDKRQISSLVHKTRVVRRALEANAVQAFGNEMLCDELITMMVAGMSTIAVSSVKILLKDLLTFPADDAHMYMIITCPESSRNGTLDVGVFHCLSFGFHPEQVTNLQEADEARDEQQINIERGRRTKHMLVPKRTSDRSRSRSRSPSPPPNTILQDSNHCHHRDAQITLEDMLDNPEDYVLKHSQFFQYFEPHKPDLIVFKETLRGSTRQTEESNGEVKIVVKIASYNRYPSCLSVKTHLKAVTEQCFLACMAGFCLNQTSITGLIIVPDGMKLIRILKRNNQGVASYVTEETDLIEWHQTQQLNNLIRFMQNEVVT